MHVNYKYLDDPKETIAAYFDDSILLPNHNGTSDMAGFCYKLKNKRSIEANFVSDNNIIMNKSVISNSQPHDFTFIEPFNRTIKSDLFLSKHKKNATYNKCLAITADVRYLLLV